MWVFPSGDVHLVKGLEPTAELRVFFIAGDFWKDASTVPGKEVLAIQSAQGSEQGVNHNITGFVGREGPPIPLIVSQSSQPGTSYHEVSVAPGDPDTSILRVTTHSGVAGLYAGDRSLSTFNGENDRVLSVFAQFTDRPDVIEDVTGHRWLKYDVANSSIADIDPDGRIQTLAAGNTTLGVSLKDGRFRFTVALTVRPALGLGLESTANSEELVRRSPNQNRTLFVLSEGYTDRRRFFAHARKSVKAWLGSQPFKQVAGRFNVIGVFQASTDKGATIGSRLIPLPNGRDDQYTLWEGGGVGIPGRIMRARDTLFGLIKGSRVATPAVARKKSSESVNDTFARPQVARALLPDDRRLPRFGIDGASFEPRPPQAAFASFIRRYIEAAGHTVSQDDRVMFLVDDEHSGGTHLQVLGISLRELPMVALTVGHDLMVSNVSAVGPLFDRAVGNAELHADRTGSEFAHEIAHSYQLADEYENIRDRTHNQFVPEHDENIQHDKSLHVGTTPLRDGGILDVSRIKWNVHRIAKVSPARNAGSNSSAMRLELPSGQAIRWKSGERAFVRNTFAVLKDVRNNPPRILSFEGQIGTVDLVNNTVDLELKQEQDPELLGAKLILYVPKVNKNGADLSLIDPAVLSYLAKNGPFLRKGPCTDPNPAIDTDYNKDVACPSIAGFSRPSNHADAIGVYEGGGNFSCDIFRPAGRCKMRTVIDPRPVVTASSRFEVRLIDVGFCFVCKYVLVDLIDPALHEQLDSQYPRDC